MKKLIYCDTCKEETEHTLIREDRNLYKCEVCSTVVEYRPEKEIEIRAIISKGAESEVGKLKAKEGELLEKGEEVVVEVEDGFRVGEITSLELENGKRSEVARAEKVKTIWLRDVGEVFVKFSLHKGPVTTPYVINSPGETEFMVGEVLNIEKGRYKITRMKLLDGRLLKKPGQKAKAKEIKRIYAIYLR